MARWGLVAIVKDESERIGDFLVKVPCDVATIVDTGSTDDTRSICELIYPGSTSVVEWDGFGPARSVAFARAHGTADWLLALDADMTVEVDPDWEPDPAVDAYGVAMGNGGAFRWRLPLVLTAIMLPYMLFICLTATASAMLNSLRHFAAPALSPVVLNLIWIIAVLVVAPLVTQDQTGRAFVVAAGVLVAGVFQLLLQVAVLLKLGMPWNPVLDLKHPGLRQTASHMAPVVIGLTIFQINVLLDSVIAVGLSSPEGRETFSLLGATITSPMRVGANTALYYGDRVMQLPLGVFGVALATAIFPTLSSCAAR